VVATLPDLSFAVSNTFCVDALSRGALFRHAMSHDALAPALTPFCFPVGIHFAGARCIPWMHGVSLAR